MHLFCGNWLCCGELYWADEAEGLAKPWICISNQESIVLPRRLFESLGSRDGMVESLGITYDMVSADDMVSA